MFVCWSLSLINLIPNSCLRKTLLKTPSKLEKQQNMLSLRKNLVQIGLKSKFHTVSPQLFKAGDKITGQFPGLVEDSPGNAVDLAKDLSQYKKAIVVQVPGAFSPACSASHIPGYLSQLQKFHDKGVQEIVFTTVNDPFVTKAWKKDLKFPEGAKAGVKLLADSEGSFAKSGDSLFDDSVKFFGNKRGTRTALVVENGEIKQVFEEPDKAGVNVSSADNVLKHL